MVLRYLAMQCIKGGSTLRISGKVGKFSPRVVYRFVIQSHGVKEFLRAKAVYQKLAFFSRTRWLRICLRNEKKDWIPRIAGV